MNAVALALLGMAASVTLNQLASAESAVSTNARALDTLVFGDATSEQNHGFRDDRSEAIVGGLREPARQLLPQDPPSFQGGSLTFTLKVDPQQQNYFTVKLWGSDRGAERGRFQLFSGNLQLGYRHEGDHDLLNATSNDAQCPGRFAYQTILLPLSLTQGKSEIELTIRSFGPTWNYGENYERFQKPLTATTRGIYRVYTHTAARFVPDASENQGVAPAATVRSSPGEEVIEQSRKVVIDRLNRTLNEGRFAGQLSFLAEAYSVEWTPTYNKPKAIDLIIQDGDDAVRKAATNPKGFNDTWTALGGLGSALAQVWPAAAGRMDEQVDLGIAGASTRRDAWATMIRRGMDYLRTHRRGFTNQSMIIDLHIYASNKGLLRLKPELAIPEAQALRYMYEGIGLEPWLGSHKTDPANADVILEDQFVRPYGGSYHTVTRKGTSRELGWVASYGETILNIGYDMVRVSGNDARLKAQLEKLQEARFIFRYPAIDNDGNRIMRMTAEIDNRHSYYPFAGATYTAAGVRESWWLDTSALFSGNQKIVGVSQQMLADGQYFPYIQGRLKDPQTAGMMRNVDDYAKVKSLPPSDQRLPMTDGQPDFVFSDEENGIVVVKHGERRIFANLYWRATYGVNGLARVLEVDPTNTRVATARTAFKLESSSGTYTRPDFIHMMNRRSHLPPAPVPSQAWAGDVLPVAAAPSDAKDIKPGFWGPFVGKASYYELRWGDYLFAINATEDKTYDVNVPQDAPATSLDLVTRQPVTAGQKLALKPLTTAVIYLR